MRLAVAIAVVAFAAWPSRPPAQTSEAAPRSTPAPGGAAATQPGRTGASTPSSGAPSAKPPAAATELARALLSQQQWSKVLDSYASSLSGQVSEALLSRGEKVPDDLRGKLRSELDRALPYQQTVQAQADALAKALTPDELKRTVAFYQSPTGRKVLERLPDAQSAVAQQLQARLATAVPDIVNRVAPKAMAGAPPGAGAGPEAGAGHVNRVAPKAMAGAPPGAGAGAEAGAGRAPGGTGGGAGQSPPVQGRRPPPEAGGSR